MSKYSMQYQFFKALFEQPPLEAIPQLAGQITSSDIFKTMQEVSSSDPNALSYVRGDHLWVIDKLAENKIVTFHATWNEHAYGRYLGRELAALGIVEYRTDGNCATLRISKGYQPGR